MVDVNFLCSYKSILYPLDVRQEGVCDDSKTSVKSLVDMSAGQLVQDSGCLLQSLDSLPQDLYFNLMRAALLHNRDRVIEILVAHWPWPSLLLTRLAPPLFDNIEVLYNNAYVGERMRRGVKFTTCLAHTFVECLKKRSPTKLKYLDLTGYPSGVLIIPFVYFNNI